MLLQAVENEDYPLMQALFLLITVAVLVAILLADIATAILDPRTQERRSDACRPSPTGQPRRGRRRRARGSGDADAPADVWRAVARNRKATAGADPAARSSSCSRCSPA